MRDFIDVLKPAWLADYNGSAFGRDALAAVILSILLIPQAMAYAQLAGLSPSVGLLTAMVAPLIYAAIGAKRRRSRWVRSRWRRFWWRGALVEIDVDPGIAAAIVAIEVGIMLVLLAAFRMGRLVNFISEPALLGFTAAAALSDRRQSVIGAFGGSRPSARARSTER